MNNYCIYMHVNKINGKKYIGRTKYGDDPNKRWRNGGHYFNQFRIDIDKYGWNNFEHIIVENNLSYEEAKIKEKEYILINKSYEEEYGYNLAIGDGLSGERNGMYGKSIKNSGMYGKKHSKLSREKMSQKAKGRIISEETKIKLSLAGKGRVFSTDTKEKIRQSNLGKKRSAETRRRISEVQKGKYTGDKNPSSKVVIVIYKDIEYKTTTRNDMIKLFKDKFDISIAHSLSGRKPPKKIINDIQLIKVGDKIIYKNC